MIPFSAVIITFNEERNIERCLDSLKDIAAEIIVVDSGSTDQTRSICERHGVTFLVHPFEGHIQQKNFALDQASNRWVLSLDADEALSQELKSSIRQIMSGKPAVGYSMNRLSNYCGTWIHHGSWYPDRKLRLFDKTKVRWTGVNPHDKAEPVNQEPTSHLKGDILHYTYYAVDEHIRKLDYFSGIAAKAYFEKGRHASWFDLHIRPGFAFFRDYILRAGFLDGYSGWLIAKFTAHYTLQKYAKLKELKLRHRHD